MSVKLEFINIIIPIRNIERCRKIGGFSGHLEISQDLIGETDWYDDKLYRTGCMNPLDIEDIVQEWADYGLTPVSEEGGVRKWNDLCVIDSANGLTLPCDWIAYDLKKKQAWIKDDKKI